MTPRQDIGNCFFFNLNIALINLLKIYKTVFVFFMTNYRTALKNSDSIIIMYATFLKYISIEFVINYEDMIM